MKRASLSARPTPPPSASADLTDRLLNREEKPQGAPTSSPPRPSRRRAKPTPVQEPAGTFEPEQQPPVLVASASDQGSSLEVVLRQATGAAEALEAAARQAPARYEVALRYRLDALAHHLRQVADFVGNFARR